LKTVAFSLTLLLALPAGAEGMRRFAVVAGNDEGGDDTRPLLYARDDARKIHDILTRLGGIRPGDSELLLNGKAADLLAALGRVEQRIREAAEHNQRTVLLFYYSGHSKDGALRLGGTEVPFDSLKSRLAQARADVRIGIFDSCQSGASPVAKARERHRASRWSPTPGEAPRAW